MGAFDAETRVEQVATDRWRTWPRAAWNIGDAANGGYALTSVLRALAEVGGHRDPLSVTTHFLRPLQPDGEPAEIVTELVRRGRTTSVVRGTLHHAGRDRLVVSAVFGELDDGVEFDGANDDADDDTAFSVPPPELTPPDDCRHRSELEQGVALPILDRLDVRIDPARAEPGASDAAVMEGWIGFVDGTAPTPLALPLLADAFPPSLYPRLGRVGWVPTIELTVHVRRRPVPGWVQARFECDDLAGGRMIETGALWDAGGRLIARSRQLGLLLSH